MGYFRFFPTFQQYHGFTNSSYGIQYKPDGSIDVILTEEELARNNPGGSYSYEYNLTDHLGNVRYTFNRNPLTGQLEKLQSDDYFAFGLRKVVDAGTNKYLYNGKELLDELGQYDYGARFYDPVVGRWNVIDPLAEKFQNLSPYNYTDNNPVNNTDPDGMDILYGKGLGGGDLYTGADAQALFVQLRGSQEENKDDKKKKKVQQEPKSNEQERQKAYNSWIENLAKLNQFMLSVMEFKIFAEGFAEGSPSKLPVPTKGVSSLRASYEAEVKGLSSIAEKMRRSGSSSEEIARVLQGLRRELGVKYKSLTSDNLLQQIYQRNLQKYGDKLGPSIDYLRQQGKSWDDIIKSATRPGGKDLGF